MARSFWLFRPSEIFHNKKLATALGDADANRIHVAVENVGTVGRRLHEFFSESDENFTPALVALPGNDASLGSTCATVFCLAISCAC